MQVIEEAHVNTQFRVFSGRPLIAIKKKPKKNQKTVITFTVNLNPLLKAQLLKMQVYAHHL